MGQARLGKGTRAAGLTARQLPIMGEYTILAYELAIVMFRLLVAKRNAKR